MNIYNELNQVEKYFLNIENEFECESDLCTKCSKCKESKCPKWFTKSALEALNIVKSNYFLIEKNKKGIL